MSSGLYDSLMLWFRPPAASIWRKGKTLIRLFSSRHLQITSMNICRYALIHLFYLMFYFIRKSFEIKSFFFLTDTCDNIIVFNYFQEIISHLSVTAVSEEQNHNQIVCLSSCRNDFTTTQQPVEVDSIILTCPEIPGTVPGTVPGDVCVVADGLVLTSCVKKKLLI